MTLYDVLNQIAGQITNGIATLFTGDFGNLVIFFVVVMLAFGLISYFWKIRK